MAKLKKAFGRQISKLKADALAANPGASDQDLANIINDMAKKQGFSYKITPEKVRTTTKKSKGKKKPAPAAASAARTTPAPAPKAASTGGISMEDIRAVRELVGRIGADKVQELAGMLAK